MSGIRESIDKNSASIKITIISVLSLLLLIPANMTSHLIKEREQRRAEVLREISSKWGYAQVITGPYLSIPYKKAVKNENGKIDYEVAYYHILPDNLSFKSDLKSEIRYRGLYEAVLYRSKIHINAGFSNVGINNRDILNHVLWDRIFISLGVSDLKGITEPVRASINLKPYFMEPGTPDYSLSKSGLSVSLNNRNPLKSYDISIDLALNGSSSIKFAPLGKETLLNLTSDWKSPSFSGSFLPNKRDITAKGFNAQWKVLHLNRNYPQQWADNLFDVGSSEFGVDLIVPADIYQRSMRTSKYALMFIGFTFAAFFFSEIFNRRRIHPIQYTLIGIAMIIFYALLISFAEHIGFGLSYFVSSLSIIALISMYSLAILKNRKISIIISAQLSALYLFLYIILQLEDYALLMGSLALLFVLGAIMFITRNIDWYALNLGEKNNDQG